LYRFLLLLTCFPGVPQAQVALLWVPLAQVVLLSAQAAWSLPQGLAAPSTLCNQPLKQRVVSLKTP
jgi:hypothetical protein